MLIECRHVRTSSLQTVHTEVVWGWASLHVGLSDIRSRRLAILKFIKCGKILPLTSARETVSADSPSRRTAVPGGRLSESSIHVYE